MGSTCHIGRPIVDPKFQNLGIGTPPMQQTENEFSDCIRYELLTGHESKKNLYFYCKLGYTESKREKINDHVILVYLQKLA